MKWYSVDERMPEYGVDVLLRFPQNMAVGYYAEKFKCWSVASGDGIYTYVSDDEEKPTHWAELPASPVD